jgi:hypothetical protein
MIPIRPGAAATAARAPGSTTPRIGTAKCWRRVSSATAEEVLHATTTISTPWFIRKRVFSTENRRTVAGDLVP